MILVFVAVAVIIGLTWFPAQAIAKPSDAWVNQIVKTNAIRNGLNPAHVYGVVMQESGGRPDAANPTDPSIGLMGVTPLIGRAYAGLVGDSMEVLVSLRNPTINMSAGCSFMKHLQDKYSSKATFEIWIQAYNEGETNFDNGKRVPAYGAGVLKHSKNWKG